MPPGSRRGGVSSRPGESQRARYRNRPRSYPLRSVRAPIVAPRTGHDPAGGMSPGAGLHRPANPSRRSFLIAVRGSLLGLASLLRPPRWRLSVDARPRLRPVGQGEPESDARSALPIGQARCGAGAGPAAATAGAGGVASGVGSRGWTMTLRSASRSRRLASRELIDSLNRTELRMNSLVRYGSTPCRRPGRSISPASHSKLDHSVRSPSDSRSRSRLGSRIAHQAWQSAPMASRSIVVLMWPTRASDPVLSQNAATREPALRRFAAGPSSRNAIKQRRCRPCRRPGPRGQDDLAVRPGNGYSVGRFDAPGRRPYAAVPCR